jgi:50S ribosome-binding GTPase
VTRPDALMRLADALGALRLGLAVPGVERARKVRDDLVGQIRDYLLPRLRQMDAPLLMVVGGSTGAGKSTLVNTLVGEVVSPAGVLRPTTRAPILACNPDDVRWFDDDRVLPGLARSTGSEAGGPGVLRLVPTAALPPGLALLDSPDIDSVSAENRALANQLLAAADAWLFVTTAARYADAVPWELLHAARERGTALAVVLNRVPADAVQEVGDHLTAMLRERGLEGAELLVVEEVPLATEGLLPDDASLPVRGWLGGLASDAEARAELVRATLAGALASIPARVGAVREAAEAQVAAADELRDEAAHAYGAARDKVEETMRSGSLLRGEVLARWHEVVGTGDVMRALESRVGWVRDRLRSLVTAKPPADAELEAAVETSVESVIRAAADGAAERTVRGWREHVTGKALLAEVPGLDTASPELVAGLEGEVRAWQGEVFELVQREGASKRTTARLASLGVNAAGLTVMLAVFSQTGGLTGAEAVVAGGTSAVGHKVLEAVFGDQSVRALAAKARADLLARVGRLLDAEADRFEALLDPVAPDRAGLGALDDAVRAVERAR